MRPLIKFFERLRNLGADANTNSGAARRIRLSNTMLLICNIAGFVVLFYACFGGWPYNSLIVLIILSALGFIPYALNYLYKTLVSRILIIILTFLSITLFTIIIGPDFHFQYFLFAALGFPLIFFGNELGKKKIFLPVTAVLLYIYLEWHSNAFDPITPVNLPYTNIISFANDFMVLLIIFFQFYFFVRENEFYTEATVENSNQLAEINTDLEHFAYIASHNLNEPLRTVDSFVDIIREEYEAQEDENLKTYFTFITDALSRMRLMLDGMLNYSRIGKSGKSQRVDVNVLINEIKTDLGELIKQNNAIIKTNNLSIITCVKVETRQLFQNLITNAIKFQQPRHTPIITITQKELPNYWQFCVADNGIGIDFKKHKAIFQIFTKLHLPKKYKGHGIGLAFCKKIVEAHNGKIWVESSLGNGSQFYFTIHKKI